MKYLAVKGFDRFQHYRDRNPPWIKLYSTILTDLAFLEMPEAAQAQLVKLWVLASQLGHPLPNKPKLLAGKIGTTGKFHLATIIAAGFLLPCNDLASADASGALTELEHDARPSVRERGRSQQRAEGELEGEQRQHQPSAVEASREAATAAAVEATLLARLESDADRIALDTVAQRAKDRGACIAALASMLSGNDPATPQPTLRVFGQALRDLATNGAPMTARLFRGYLRDALREPARAEPFGAGTPGNGDGGARREQKSQHPEHWKDKQAREEREESTRQSIRIRSGNVEQRRAKDDGEAWWARMQREAATARLHPVLYAYDHMTESEAAHV